jgi:hypothetical protein
MIDNPLNVQFFVSAYFVVRAKKVLACRVLAENSTDNVTGF